MPVTTYTHVEWDGDRIEAKMAGAAADGLVLATEHLLALSQAIVPLEEAILQRSGQADVDRHGLTGSVSYDTPYAVVQHERLDYRHDPGRQAKYLEAPYHEQQAVLIALVAAPIRKALRG